jgi:hypothetical protein
MTKPTSTDYPDIQQFRIYSPEEDTFHFSGGTPTMLSFFFEKTATLHTVHLMPYERCVWLKDKQQSNFIYEGDIVTPTSGLYKGRPLEIYFDEIELCFFASPKNRKYRHLRITGNKKFNILGNIHQNLELLLDY